MRAFAVALLVQRGETLSGEAAGLIQNLRKAVW